MYCTTLSCTDRRMKAYLIRAPAGPMACLAQGSFHLSEKVFFLEWTAVRSLGGAVVNGSKVVVVERCRTKIEERLLSRTRELCEGLQRKYIRRPITATSLTQRSRWCPPGESPAPYWLEKEVSAGAILVVIHHNFVQPFPGVIPWSTLSFSFPAEQVPRIIDTLGAVPAQKLLGAQMGNSHATA